MLVLLDGRTEATTTREIIASTGASAICVTRAEAADAARQAAEDGAPFTKLLTNLAYAEFGTTALVPLLGPAQGQSGPRVAVIIDPSERDAYAAQMADKSLSAFLVRPVRPVSALTQLFASRDVDTAPVHRLGVARARSLGALGAARRGQ